MFLIYISLYCLSLVSVWLSFMPFLHYFLLIVEARKLAQDLDYENVNSEREAERDCKFLLPKLTPIGLYCCNLP